MRLSYRTLGWSEEQYTNVLLTTFAMSPAIVYILFGMDFEFAVVVFMVVISTGVVGYLKPRMSLNHA